MKTKAATSRRGQVWRATLERRFHGWLITDAGNVDRPIAFIESDDPAEMVLARKVAKDIEADFESGVQDLRRFGNRCSVAAMPDIVYALVLTDPADDLEERRKCQPYCRWRFAKLFQQHLAEWRDELGDAQGDVTFGVIDESGRHDFLAFDIATASVMLDVTDERSPREAMSR